MLCFLLALCILPIPFAFAEKSGDSGDGGGGGSTTYVTVNGGTNSLGSADSVSVSTSITNITANTVTVYVEGDYNPQYLFNPRVTELHMVNNQSNALWNPTISEIPTTFHAAVMKQAKLAILYDGWIDLENVGSYKPNGAQRYCEIMGYDLYARRGEVYTQDAAGNFTYTADGGLYSAGDPVNHMWAVMHLYRALGIEKVHYYAQTFPAPEDYDINTSPLVQALTMPMSAPDLSAGLTYVAATRTLPEEYLPMAISDGLDMSKSLESITVADFCILASELMHIYGEPVLTEQETVMLLQAYGKDLPYGLPSRAVEAIKYLLARGIIETDMDWRSALSFEDAATLLMRIKDPGSRLTFKEIELTADIGLLTQGYHPIEITDNLSPIAVTERQEAPYAQYTTYDYFIEYVEGIAFKSAAGAPVTPIMCNGTDNRNGQVSGSKYLGLVTIKGKQYYHFTVEQVVDSVVINGNVHINTAVEDDMPHRYILPAPSSGTNPGGIYYFTGTVTPDTQITSWEWHSLDEGDVPAEYCDKPRKEKDVLRSTAQHSLFATSSYGYTLSVYVDNLSDVSFQDAAGTVHTLKDLTTGKPVDLGNGMKLSREKVLARYAYFTVEGCDNKNTLSEIFTCSGKTGYQSFPAYSKMDDQYLVSVKFLKSVGAIWDFTPTGDKTYYIGVNTAGATYSSIFVNMGEKNPFAVRGTQLTIYPEDTILVTEADADYYIDYSLVLGIAGAVKFENSDGTVSLSRCDGGTAKTRVKCVYNANNAYADKANPWIEYATFVEVEGKGAVEEYIYAPASYPLANWVVVDNLDTRVQALFSFYPSTAPDTGSAAAKALEDYLGLSVEGTGWDVYHTVAPPVAQISVDFKDGTYTLANDNQDFAPILFVPTLDAFLIKPYAAQGTDNYGSFQGELHKQCPTSIVAVDDVYADWNYNLYTGATAGTIIYSSADGTCLKNISSWRGEKEFPLEEVTPSEPYVEAFAAVGVPGLLGAPKSNASAVSNSRIVDTYSGIAYMVRSGEGSTLTQSASGTTIQYVLVHATPYKAWLQSAGFMFKDLDNSFRGEESADKPDTVKGTPVTKYDWKAFLKDLGRDDADDWLTIAVIAVLDILPRIFMFIFIALLGLSLIADVKPWKIFCDKVFDPYRLLTLGRKTVHTIQVKMVFLYSLAALILYGLFQNGLILEIIAWAARGVVGIIRR